MQIIRNSEVLQKASSNLSAIESSNMAMVIQSPTLLATWYPIDPNLTETVLGWNNVSDYIGKMSEAVYNKIEGLPIGGVDNLAAQSTFDEEIGYDEDLQSSGIIYPNTIFPKPNDCFTIQNSEVSALYVVTDIKPVTVKSNPFIEIAFRLLSRNPDTIEQLERQVKETYAVMMSPLSQNNSLVISKKTYETINSQIDQYMELCYMYQMLFYDENKAAFVFDGLPDPENELRRAVFIDMMLWKFMFDEGIIIFDNLLVYAINNCGKSIDRIYTGTPDVYLDEYSYRRSIISRIFTRDKRKTFDKYRFPNIWNPTERITKYQGQNIWYMENYLEHPSGPCAFGTLHMWDDEFLCRIRNNNPYDKVPLHDNQCSHCKSPCYHGTPLICFNPYLRNVIIHWYNNEDDKIDWDGLQVSDDRTIENYYLIPIVLGIYKQYIQGLQT